MPSLLHGSALPLLCRSSSFLASSPRLAANAPPPSHSPSPEPSPALQQLREMGMDECFTKFLHNQMPSLVPGSLEKVGLLLEEGVTVPQLNLLVCSSGLRGAQYLLRLSLPRLESLLGFLKSVQVEKQTLGVFLIRLPIFLNMRVEGLERKVKLLQSLGMERKHVGRAAVRAPRVFTLSNHTLEQRLGFWRDFGLKDASICRMMQVYPEIACLNCSLKTKPLLECFETYGFSKEVVSMSIVHYPRCLKPSMENISRNMELLQQLGFLRTSKEFMVAALLLACYRTERLEAGFRWLTSYGFSAEDAKQLVRKCPSILTKRSETCERILDYILNVLKRDMKEVLKFPRCMTCSLERRIKPRFTILAERQEHHSLRTKYSLSYILSSTDANFQRRFQPQRKMAGLATLAQMPKQSSG